MTEQMWIGILYVVSGIGLVALCVPLLAGRMSRNRWYGFRIPKSYESEENWLLINRYGARHMIRRASAMAGIGAFLIAARTLDEQTYQWLAITAPLLLLIPVVQTLWYARRVG